MLIRDARPDEAGELTEPALRSKAHWGYDAAFMASCREELTVHPSEVGERRTAPAERDGRVLGFTTVDGRPPDGAVGMMFVDPSALGQGVGRALFAHALATARAAGFHRLTIEADPTAEPFHRAMGAVRSGGTPSGSIPGRVLPLLAVTL
ncbi:GNAT family N-acetyltransferase [Streptomyces sp. I5]|uniref:GNAT family N-acetyltransferase n=1 Tax=Streptomyces sp. I5 TaxID=2759947 RepID=UPI0018EEC91F|nr:GNAT family N-acetyltransferase [Streptomyces sp. I5]MBJ6635003.1 GNAT family N-acetyltransferase [Streptomyces sp. I5]